MNDKDQATARALLDTIDDLHPIHHADQRKEIGEAIAAALRAERGKAIAECLNLNYEQRKALFDACQQAQEAGDE